MGKRSKRPKKLSGKGPPGVPKSGVSAALAKPTPTKESGQLTAAPQNGEVGPLPLAELYGSCAEGVDQQVKRAGQPRDETNPNLNT